MSVYKKNVNFIQITYIKLIYRILSINNVISTKSRKPIVFRDFVNQHQFSAFLLSSFHDKAK